MTVSDFYARMLSAAAIIESIDPACASPEAHCALLAIAGQESDWQDIDQIDGPAEDPWQFEIGGVRALCITDRHMPALARACGVGIDPHSIFDALIENWPLAYGCARRLLLSVPAPLPKIGDEDETFAQYAWAWRPGALRVPRRAAEARARFSRVYPQAVACFLQSAAGETQQALSATGERQ